MDARLSQRDGGTSGEPPPGPLAGQVVLVTGASRGIGRAIALACAADGASVAVHHRVDRAGAEATLAALAPPAPGAPGHLVVAADVGRPDEVAALVDDVVGRIGTIDVLVNNAGIYEAHPVLTTSPEAWRGAWDRTLAANLLGPADLIHRVAPVMVAAGGGRIVNVTSRGAIRGEPDHPAYGASKAGLHSLSQSMARALAPHGIVVTEVAPGWVATDMAADHLDGPDGNAIRAQHPLGRVVGAEEVAAVVAFLARPGLASTTGAVVDVNGASYLRS